MPDRLERQVSPVETPACQCGDCVQRREHKRVIKSHKCEWHYRDNFRDSLRYHDKLEQHGHFIWELECECNACVSNY